LQKFPVTTLRHPITKHHHGSKHLNNNRRSA
jgi:hypothetical protein